ncbi:MAG: serine hydrolase [Deltaproteobacteria bacterium]|nr:serine hydrolase [Deltaproteobacteria bacterium]
MPREWNWSAIAAFAVAFMLSAQAAAAAPSPCAEGPERSDAQLKRWVEEDAILRAVAAQASATRLQLRIYLPPSNDAPCGRLMTYREDAEYLYPASAIKIVPAIAVLSHWSEGRAGTPPLDAPLLFSDKQADDAFGHTLRVGGYRPQSLADHLEAMLVESSNGSFNALYELAGPVAQNEPFHRGGFPSVRVIHRLSGYNLPKELAAYMPSVAWMRGGERVVWLPERSVASLPASSIRLPREEIGAGYLEANSGLRVDAPMPFGMKNGVTLADLQRLLVALFHELPETDAARLPPLSDESTSLMLSLMRGPLSEKDGVSAESREARFKPMLPGLLELGIERSQIDYTNKAGRAYGFHLDNARIRIGDQVAYVTVGMLANSDGVFNDDRYDYDALSFPALRAVGAMVGSKLFGLNPAKSP